MSFDLDSMVTSWGDELVLEPSREMEETCVPFRVFEVLEQFREAAQMGKRRKLRRSAGFRIFEPEADQQRSLEWVKANPELARKIGRDYYHRHPERQRAYAKAKRERLKADPASHAKRLASWAAKRERQRASPEAMAKLREQARARYARKKAAQRGDP